MVGFFKYLTGGYGGKVMPKDTVEHVCHVQILLNTINADGDDMYFLVKKKGLYISDIQGTPSQRKEVDKCNVEVLSEKCASIFHLCTPWFASGKAFQNFQWKNFNSAKVARKLQQNHTLFDYHTNDHKHGEEAMTAFKDEDINHFYK